MWHWRGSEIGEDAAIYGPSRVQLRRPVCVRVSQLTRNRANRNPNGWRRVGFAVGKILRTAIDLKGNTVAQLRGDIDAGRTGDKVDWPDPAAVPLGTDEEAAGTPPDASAVEMALRLEMSRSSKSIAHRGVGAGWLLIAFAVALGMGLVAWILWQAG
jgi:hypothetical protein